MGVLPVNMPQWGGSLLRFVMMSSQIPTLARGGGGGGRGVSIDKCIKRVKIFRDSHDPKKVIKLTYQSKLGDF